MKTHQEGLPGGHFHPAQNIRILLRHFLLRTASWFLAID